MFSGCSRDVLRMFSGYLKDALVGLTGLVGFGSCRSGGSGGYSGTSESSGFS